MTKRLVDIDDDVLAAARDVLGTSTLKDTVNAALRRSAESGRRGISEEDWDRFAAAAADLSDPDVMGRAWE